MRDYSWMYEDNIKKLYFYGYTKDAQTKEPEKLRYIEEVHNMYLKDGKYRLTESSRNLPGFQGCTITKEHFGRVFGDNECFCVVFDSPNAELAKELLADRLREIQKEMERKLQSLQGVISEIDTKEQDFLEK